MEMSLSCDNLLCDALGRTPSCTLIIYVRNLNENHVLKGPKDECIPNFRQSLKDSAKIESAQSEDSFPDNITNQQSYTPPLHTKHLNTSFHPLWKKYSVTENVDVSRCLLLKMTCLAYLLIYVCIIS